MPPIPSEIAFQSYCGSSRVLAALYSYNSPPSLDSPIILPSQEHRPPFLVFAQLTTILRGLGSYMPPRFPSSPGRQAQWKGLLIGGCPFETPKGLLEDVGCLELGVAYSWWGWRAGMWRHPRRRPCRSRTPRTSRRPRSLSAHRLPLFILLVKQGDWPSDTAGVSRTGLRWARPLR